MTKRASKRASKKSGSAVGRKRQTRPFESARPFRRTIYRDSKTGYFASKKTWRRSKAQNGTRFKRKKIKLSVPIRHKVRIEEEEKVGVEERAFEIFEKEGMEEDFSDLEDEEGLYE
jgi:hypothetical protein